MNGEEKANENALSSGVFNGQTAIRQEVPADVEGAGARLTAWFALRSFQHDALLRVYDCGAATVDDRAVIFCVREPSDGDLETALARGPLHTDEAVELFSALLRALVFLHAHGHVCSGVEPPDVHACGTRTKLFPQRLRRETEVAEREVDLRSVGELIVRATSTGSGTDEIRDRRLRLLAVSLLNRSGRIPNAESSLRAFESRRWTRRQASAMAAMVVVLAVFLGTRAYNEARQPTSTSAPAIDDRPSPIDTAEPPIEPEEPAPAPVQRLADRSGKDSYEQQRSRNGESDWAVIAATYKSFGAAQRRANSLKAAFGECTCSVFPRDGDGQNYYVVVASSLTWDAAERARARAVAAGLPEDTYVTRLGSKRAETTEPPQP